MRRRLDYNPIRIGPVCNWHSIIAAASLTAPEALVFLPLARSSTLYRLHAATGCTWAEAARTYRNLLEKLRTGGACLFRNVQVRARLKEGQVASSSRRPLHAGGRDHDAEGKKSGEYRWDARATVKALELLGKYVAMFVDRSASPPPRRDAQWKNSHSEHVPHEEVPRAHQRGQPTRSRVACAAHGLAVAPQRWSQGWQHHRYREGTKTDRGADWLRTYPAFAKLPLRNELLGMTGRSGTRGPQFAHICILFSQQMTKDPTQSEESLEQIAQWPRERCKKPFAG